MPVVACPTTPKALFVTPTTPAADGAVPAATAEPTSPADKFPVLALPVTPKELRPGPAFPTTPDEFAPAPAVPTTPFELAPMPAAPASALALVPPPAWADTALALLAPTTPRPTAIFVAELTSIWKRGVAGVAPVGRSWVVALALTERHRSAVCRGRRNRLQGNRAGGARHRRSGESQEVAATVLVATRRVHFPRPLGEGMGAEISAKVVEFLALLFEDCTQTFDTVFEAVCIGRLFASHGFWAAGRLEIFRGGAGAWLATNFPNPPAGL